MSTSLLLCLSFLLLPKSSFLNAERNAADRNASAGLGEPSKGDTRYRERLFMWAQGQLCQESSQRTAVQGWISCVCGLWVWPSASLMDFLGYILFLVRKSKAADEKRRSLAKQAREDYKRLSQRGRSGEGLQNPLAGPQKPRRPPLPPKPQFLHPLGNSPQSLG